MLLFGGKVSEPICLENASNLTKEFLHENFNNKILLNFLFIFFLKNKPLSSESVNKDNVFIHIDYNPLRLAKLKPLLPQNGRKKLFV